MSRSLAPNRSNQFINADLLYQRHPNDQQLEQTFGKKDRTLQRQTQQIADNQSHLTGQNPSNASTKLYQKTDGSGYLLNSVS